MSKLAWSIFTVVATAATAHASPEPWCGEPVHEQFSASRGNFLYNSDADDLADDSAFVNVVGASCMNNGEDNAKFHTQLAAARARWAKRLHMSDADWADAAAWIRQPQSERWQHDLAPKDHASYSELGPIDQYARLSHMSWLGAGSYLADALGPKLTEAGRVAYLQNCLRDKYAGPGKDTGGPAAWALCWGDADALDLDKLGAELRADTAHDGFDKMTVRIAAWKASQLVAQRRTQLDKSDPVYKQLIEIAAKARKSWSASPELLALVGALDDAKAKQSRSLHVDGCAEKARSALAAQVTALPSSVFADMPMAPKKGDENKRFETAQNKLVAAVTSTPDGYLAALAVALCASDGDATELAHAIERAIDEAPALRGPRGAALAAMLASKLEPDARDEKVEYPKGGHEVKLAEVNDKVWSKGVIAKVTRKGDVVHVEYSGKNLVGTICTSTRSTNHVRGVRDDGQLQYDQECDAHETTHYNNAPKPIDVPIADGAALKPGMAVQYADGVMMAWAKPGDARPVVALGVAIKK